MNQAEFSCPLRFFRGLPLKISPKSLFGFHPSGHERLNGRQGSPIAVKKSFVFLVHFCRRRG